MEMVAMIFAEFLNRLFYFYELNFYARYFAHFFALFFDVIFITLFFLLL